LIVTTSRYAGQAIRIAAGKFAKAKKSKYVARGKRTIRELAEFAWRKGHSKIVIIGREKPRSASAAGKIIASEINIDEWGKWKWGSSYEI